MSDTEGREAATAPRIETVAIHGGQHPDPIHGAVMQPIVLSSTFAQPEPGKPLRYDYSRSGNPTRAALEAALAALEGGELGFAFGSGCGAAATMLNTLRPGDHVLCGDDVYGGTYRLFNSVIRPLGIEVTFVDMRIGGQRRGGGLRPNTRMIWLETPTNPMLKLVDIAAVSALGRARGIPVVVDNTFASPVLQRPLALGADRGPALDNQIHKRSLRRGRGAPSSPATGSWASAWPSCRTPSARSPVRWTATWCCAASRPCPCACNATSRAPASWPAGWRPLPASSGSTTPGWPATRSTALARKQMSGPGGMISLELEGGLDESRRFLKTLKLFTLAESLGGVESLAEHPAIMTHASIPAEIRRGLGISDSLVRLSVGLEHVEDLWGDLEGGLRAARGR